MRTLLYLGCILMMTVRLADAGNVWVVLAGGGGERIAHLVSIRQQVGDSPVLLTSDGVVSRWSSDEQKNLTSAEWGRKFLLDHGFAADQVMILPFTRSGTVYDALHVRRALVGLDCDQLVVVTSDYHVDRAGWIIRRVLGSGNPRVDMLGVAPPKNLPLNARLKRWRAVLLEPVKSLWYRLRIGLGGLPPGS
ncbi:MAG: hypothetical protein Tsb0017_06440 [Geothermobacteraceae bacterium]